MLACSVSYGQGYLQDIEHSATSVLLNPICLLSLGSTPAGATFETGITASTSGLQISVKADNAATWTDYTQAGSTINQKSSAVGVWETPDAGDAHWIEAQTEGCYQIDLPDSTWSSAGSKYVTIKVTDGGTEFADKAVIVNLNSIAAADLVDLVWDEPVSGHTTADTTGDQVGAQSDTDTTNIRNDISGLSDGSSPVWAYGLTIQTGVADGGTLTSITDDTLTESDAGYWAQGAAVVFTGGSVAGQTRCISNFVPATDTISFWPATTQAVATDDTYIIIAAPTCRNFP